MFNFELKPPVVLYARVSSDKQKDRNTVAGQVDAINGWCRFNSVTLSATYIDEGVNGDLPWTERPDANRLLMDAAAGLVGTVLLFLYDRFSRDVHEGLEAAKSLKASGATPFSIQEPFDISTPFGAYMFVQSLNNAQLNKANFLERSRLGTNRRAREGAYLGGVVPYGYTVNRTTRDLRLVVAIAPIPGAPDGLSESDVVRMMYRWILDDRQPTSCMAIAQKLNGMGIPPRYTSEGRTHHRKGKVSIINGLWGTTSVVHILRSSMYKGVKQFGKRTQRSREIIEHPCPRIVSDEDWEKAQVRISQNQLSAKRNTKHDYLLSGLMKCQHCGFSYIGMGMEKGGVFVRKYACNGRQSFRLGSGIDPALKCIAGALKADEVEATIWGQIVEILREPATVVSRLQLIGEQSKHRESSGPDPLQLAHQQITEAKAELTKLDAQRARIRALSIRESITDDEADLEFNANNAAKLVQTERIKVAQKVLMSQAERESIIAESVSEIERLSSALETSIGTMDTQQKRRLIMALISGIQIETVVLPDRPFSDRQTRIHLLYRFLENR